MDFFCLRPGQGKPQRSSPGRKPRTAIAPPTSAIALIATAAEKPCHKAGSNGGRAPPTTARAVVSTIGPATVSGASPIATIGKTSTAIGSHNPAGGSCGWRG